MARKEWLVDGDRNSRYFRQSMKARKSHFSIVKIKDSSGVWVDDVAQIQKLFVHDFNKQFRSTYGNLPTIEVDLPKVLTQEDNDNLVKPIEDCKIKDAVFQMDKFKAPRPDGFGATFFFQD